MKISSLVFLIIMLACCFNLRDLSWAQQHGSVRAPWDQLPGAGSSSLRGECDYNDFIAGKRHANATTKTEIFRKCGHPQNDFLSDENWHYVFENEIYIFIFNSRGKLIKKMYERLWD